MELEGSDVIGFHSARVDRGLESCAAAKVDEFGVRPALAVEMPDNSASPHSDNSVLPLLLCNDSRGGSAVRRFDRLAALVRGVGFAGGWLLELDTVERPADDADSCA